MVSHPAPDTGTETEIVAERAVAYLIDFVFLSAVAFVIWLVFAAIQGLLGFTMASGGTGGSFQTVNVVGLLVSVIMWLTVFGAVGTYFTLLHAKMGQTVGKRLLDLVVVDAGGEECSTGQAAKRTLVLLAPAPVMILVSFVPILGFLLALGLMVLWLVVELVVMVVDDESQRLGDSFANTLVVQEKPT